MTPPFGPRAVDVELAERGVTEDLLVGALRLMQDLAPVGHEEQRRPFAGDGIAEPAIVERSDHRLARAGRSHDEIAVAIVDHPFGLESIQHLLLVGIRAYLEPGQ